MKLHITWHGHACFSVFAPELGVRIIFDPFSPIETGRLSLPKEKADVVVCSHDHFDHNNYRDVVKPDGVYFVGLVGRRDVKGVSLIGVKTFHDDAGGTLRGLNSVTVAIIGDARLVHLGDLGHVLTPEQVREITAYGRPHVVFVPVGGVYTIDPKSARHVIRQLNPHIAVPMHYRHPLLNPQIFGRLYTLDDFLREWDGPVRTLDTNSFELDTAQVPEETTVYVLRL